MKRLSVILSLIDHRRYPLTLIVCALLVIFLGENSFVNSVRLKSRISDLETEISQYEKIHKSNMSQLNSIRHDPSAYGRIARERYFVKADDEDIYVLSEEE